MLSSNSTRVRVYVFDFGSAFYLPICATVYLYTGVLCIFIYLKLFR